MIRLADYIAQRCVEAGAEHVFLVTGGGAMHLNDAFARNKALDQICFHHEQAAAMAAEAYYRLNNKLAVLNVTTGPGGINALNGVYGAYVDSIGMIVVSGQVKNETYSGNYSNPIRQLGDQEVNIVNMVKPITKYAVVLTDPLLIREVMDKAIFLVKHGRAGPVWIDVPVDMQSAMIDPEKLNAFDGNTKKLIEDPCISDNTRLELETLNNFQFDFEKFLLKLQTSKRPVIYVGSGVSLSGMRSEFIKLIEKLKIPVVVAFNANDLVPTDHACYAGYAGTIGTRAGNFSVQNSDLILILGNRLNIRTISYNFKNFASKAYKIMVDVDKAELDKVTLNIDWKVQADLRNFIPELINNISSYEPNIEHLKYLDWCKTRVEKYPAVLPEYKHLDNMLNPYKFMGDLFKHLNPHDVIVCGNASACIISLQSGKIKEGQRIFTNSGSASMGYDLPASIGASIAIGKNRVICLAGDGSLMMNIQELQTIVEYNLPIKILVINNSGYLSIKQTQTAYFSDNVFGTNAGNGVSFPNYVSVSKSFGLASCRVTTMDHWFSTETQTMFLDDNPALIEIMVDPNQIFSPKLAAKRLADGSLLAPSLEHMSPFLSDEEMQQNIIRETI